MKKLKKIKNAHTRAREDIDSHEYRLDAQKKDIEKLIRNLGTLGFVMERMMELMGNLERRISKLEAGKNAPPAHNPKWKGKRKASN